MMKSASLFLLSISTLATGSVDESNNNNLLDAAAVTTVDGNNNINNNRNLRAHYYDNTESGDHVHAGAGHSHAGPSYYDDGAFQPHRSSISRSLSLSHTHESNPQTTTR